MEEQRSVALVQGMPFLLSDSGAPLQAVNSWLRSLPSTGAGSPKTWRAYALDLQDWADFLGKRKHEPLEADRDDLAAYHAERRLGDAGSERVLGASSWNRKVTAIEGFYSWAVEEGLIPKAPFTYRYSRVVLSSGGTMGARKNLAKEKTGRAHANIKWLSQEQLTTFLDVGMNGLLPDGGEDPSFRGRNAARNRAFAELLSSTGMRVQEASHLLVSELPELPSKQTSFIRMSLPAPICKGGTGRWILIPPATLRGLNSYQRMERANAAARGGYSPSRALPFTELQSDSVHLPTKTALSKLGVDQRERLVQDGVSPLLFLQSDGSPVTHWAQVFESAVQRCRRWDAGFPAVTPHTLRHTFAVHMLQFLISQVARGINRQASEGQAELAAGYWRLHDPLLTLRDLLGHASVATTQIYLSAIDATRWYANYSQEEEDGQLD